MKIICIGRNYIDHAKEMKSPVPKKPVFFMKPETALLTKNRPFYYPPFSKEIHYEVELVFKITRNGKHIRKEFADSYYGEVGLGIDFTARDLQRECKEKGLPWEIAKAFTDSAPVSEIFPVTKLKDKDNIHFHLEKNGKIVQQGVSSDMIFNMEDIVSYVSQFVMLRMGDLVFTGTPVGVGPVKIGDRLVGFIEDREMFNFEVK